MMAWAIALGFAALVAWVVWDRRKETMTARALLAVGSGCAYTQRVQQGGAWRCPDGTADTGRSWGDPDGDKQCLKGCRVSPACEYRGRVFTNGAWRCPDGWADTGLTWGVANGDKQCQRCPAKAGCSFTQRVKTSDGEWRCPPGTLDTGRSWGVADGDKQCLGACCPTGYKGREGGTSDLFACGPWDIQRDGGIRRGSDNGKPDELLPFCCQWTNKDCRRKGFAGWFQRIKDSGTSPTGYYSSDDGCNVNVWDENGTAVAVTGKGMSTFASIAMLSMGQGLK